MICSLFWRQTFQSALGSSSVTISIKITFTVYIGPLFTCEFSRAKEFYIKMFTFQQFYIIERRCWYVIKQVVYLDVNCMKWHKPEIISRFCRHMNATSIQRSLKNKQSSQLSTMMNDLKFLHILLQWEKKDIFNKRTRSNIYYNMCDNILNGAF